MNTKKRIWLIAVAALLGFACAPVLSPSLIPTLDPASLNTAIALTAGAASGQTASIPQSALNTPAAILAGPTLDAKSLNTAIAQTAGAAATQTAGLLPPKLTPSLTPNPTWTPLDPPTATAAFVVHLPATATKPPTPRSSGGGSGGGGGGDGGGEAASIYSCRQLRVSPPNYSILAPGQAFEVTWIVKNKGANWPGNSVFISYWKGNIPYPVGRYGPLSHYEISGGDTVPVPNIRMTAPSSQGIYTVTWNLNIDDRPFCGLNLTILVRNP